MIDPKLRPLVYDAFSSGTVHVSTSLKPLRSRESSTPTKVEPPHKLACFPPWVSIMSRGRGDGGGTGGLIDSIRESCGVFTLFNL